MIAPKLSDKHVRDLERAMQQAAPDEYGVAPASVRVVIDMEQGTYYRILVSAMPYRKFDAQENH